MQLLKKLAAAVIVAGLMVGSVSAAPCPPPPPAPVTVLYPAPAPLPSPQYLGSEDYYQGHGGNPRDYVSALYADVLHRPPSEAEIQRWTAQLGSSGDGVVLAREFLTFAQGEIAAHAPPPPPVIVVQSPPPPARHSPPERHFRR
jgi:hypothetical protein